MAKKIKTNALRMLDKKKIAYDLLTYDANDGKIDGISVAEKINESSEYVYKTLVLTGKKGHYTAVIPVASSLDIKALSAAAGEKKLEMLAVKDLERTTGYIRGGCSPIGMRKLLPTFIDASAQNLEKMVVSAGQIGVQMKLTPEALIKMTNGVFEEIATDEA